MLSTVLACRWSRKGIALSVKSPIKMEVLMRHLLFLLHPPWILVSSSLIVIMGSWQTSSYPGTQNPVTNARQPSPPCWDQPCSAGMAWSLEFFWARLDRIKNGVTTKRQEIRITRAFVSKSSFHGRCLKLLSSNWASIMVDRQSGNRSFRDCRMPALLVWMRRICRRSSSEVTMFQSRLQQLTVNDCN